MKQSEHIKELMMQAEDDFGATEALFLANYYGQCLFWAHLTLEKFCKALWVFKNESDNYPYIHNLLRLLKECNVKLSDEQKLFYAEMNQFQAVGRYGDYLKKLESTITLDVCKKLITEVKNQMLWIKQQMENK